jgi:type I restriction enzyme R subunit
MPPVHSAGLWSAQRTAVMNLETSFAEDRPRALIQMATGSGKTYTAITSIYRLIKYANAHRVLFLVDRRNLGNKPRIPIAYHLMMDESSLNLQCQHLTSIPLTYRQGGITTIQRLYSMLRGDKLDSLEEGSVCIPAAD